MLFQNIDDIDVEKQKKSHARMVAFSIVGKNLSSRCQSFGL